MSAVYLPLDSLDHSSIQFYLSTILSTIKFQYIFPVLSHLNSHFCSPSDFTTYLCSLLHIWVITFFLCHNHILSLFHYSPLSDSVLLQMFADILIDKSHFLFVLHSFIAPYSNLFHSSLSHISMIRCLKPSMNFQTIHQVFHDWLIVTIVIDY